MGFMDFLKKSKKEDPRLAELEPPPPPPMEESLKTGEGDISEAGPGLEEPMPLPIDVGVDSEDYETEDTDLPIKPAMGKEETMFNEEEKPLRVTQPIFVEAEHYRSMIQQIAEINMILKRNSDELKRVEQFSEDKDKELEKWKKQILDLQKKLMFVDKILFESSVKEGF